MSPSQRNTASVLLLGGTALAILSQVTQIALPIEQRTPPIVLLIIGILLYLLGATAAKRERVSEWLEQKLSRPAQSLDIQPWQVAALVISLFFSILVHYAAGDNEKMLSSFAALGAWLIGIGACLAGGWKSNGLDLRSKWKPFAIALGFALLAFPLRGIATGTIPIILNGDEASAGIQGIDFLRGNANNVFAVSWYGFPGLYFLIPAASISIFGNTTMALRIPSAIAGALTVGGTYLAGRAMFDKRIGLIAAIALAGFHFHIHFSRIGLNNIWDGLFFVITVGAAWYAWEKESRNAYMLAGLGLGFSQYFYPSSRALLVVVYGAIIISGILNRTKLKRSLANIFLMAFMMIIILLPLVWYYIKFPEQYLAPLGRVSVLGPWLENEKIITGLPAWRIMLKQFILGIQAFTYIPLQHWYRPEVPFLRPLFAGVFLLGLINLVFRPKDSRSIILFLWLGMYVLIGGLSKSTPASQRYVAAAPACILILAYGLGETGNILERLWPKSTRWVTVAVLGIAIFLAADDVNFYFNKYTPHTVMEFGHNEGVIAQQLANDLQGKPQGTQAFFFIGVNMGYYSIPSISYLAPQVEGFDVLHPWGSSDNPVPTSNHLVFIFLPENQDDIPAIQANYPGGTLQEKLGIDKQTLYWLYEYETGQ